MEERKKILLHTILPIVTGRVSCTSDRLKEWECAALGIRRGDNLSAEAVRICAETALVDILVPNETK